jgi:two-component system cell cycle sensor histidine kinase PleC
MTSRSVQPGSILVIDDDSALTEIASRTLQSAGYRQIETTTDPTLAVELCRRFLPDVMLLDLHMPGLDGFGVMAAVRESDIGVKPAVVMITGEGDGLLRTKAYEEGARDYITKPFDSRELLARVGNAVETVRLTRRLEVAVAERTAKLAEAVELLRHAERELARQLAHSEAHSRSKSELLAETAHELRTPLTAILGYAEAVKDRLLGPVDNVKYAEYAGRIHSAGLHLMKIVEDLLDLSREELGEHRPNFVPVDVAEVVKEAASLLDIQAQAAGVSLGIHIDPNLPTVRTDPTKLRQIILNLGSNAVKYTPANGRVMIEARPDTEDGVVVLIVRDTGIGIARDQLARVMKPFGRTAEAKATGAIGTGLGLSLTQRYVQMLGGTFAIESVPGRSTVVTVKLPAVPDAAEAKSSSAGA